MRTARWTLAFFLVALGLLGGLKVSEIGGEVQQDPSHPDEGALAPVFAPASPRVQRLRLPSPPGRLIDLDAVDERVAILARNGWTVHSGTGEPVWHGEETRGAPAWLSPAESIVLVQDTVFILEPQRSILSVWDSAGTRIGEIPIPLRRDLAQRATRVILGPPGRPVVVLQGMDRDGTAFWEILELDRDGEVTGAVSLPSRDATAIFQEPQLATHGEALLAMSSLSHRLWAVDLEHGELHPVATRESPPLWVLPRTERKKHEAVLARMPGSMAARSRLPDHWPSVREFTVQKDGTLLQITTAGEAVIQLEQLSIRLEPLGRATMNGFESPVFLSRGRAFVAEEGLEETRIDEIVF